MPALTFPVDVGPRRLDDLVAPAGEEAVTAVRAAAEPLRGLRVVHLATPPFAPDALDVLRSSVPLLRDAGLDVRWLAVAGDGAGRRAAVRGTVAIGVTSALVNLAVKSAWSRERPDRAGVGVPLWRNVRMPTSTSFPSGHAASGFAFAAAIGRDQPWLGLALRFLAATVAYSRVHTGVHYPGDIVVGSLIGEGTGQAVAGLMDRLPRPRRSAPDPETGDPEGSRPTRSPG